MLDADCVTVFVVVRYEYSSTWVTGVFETRQGAQAFVDAMDDVLERALQQIEEFPLKR